MSHPPHTPEPCQAQARSTDDPGFSLSVLAVSLYLALASLVLLVTLRGIFRRLRGPFSRPPRIDLDAPCSKPSAVPRREARVAMPEHLSEITVCRECGSPYRDEGERLVCAAGHVVPVVRGIPRFVPDEDYASSFGFEWNLHSSTQIDSSRGDRISEKTLAEKTGLERSEVTGKLVLDAGVGSGRFSEVLADWGAQVVGVDLSSAVDAAAQTLSERSNVWIAQADLRRLPFPTDTFDLIVSIGVLHHTPDTRRSFEALVELLRPGGTIAIWVYPDQDIFPVRADWIPFTCRIPSESFHLWCRWFVHRMHRLGKSRLARLLHDHFPYSRQGLGIEWDVLDTFDGYSPRHHGVHGFEEVEAWFGACGLKEIRRLDWATAVRGRKPAEPAQAL